MTLARLLVHWCAGFVRRLAGPLLFLPALLAMTLWWLLTGRDVDFVKPLVDWWEGAPERKPKP
jgi:hypothetical protein